jgi:hypothetical protein
MTRRSRCQLRNKIPDLNLSQGLFLYEYFLTIMPKRPVESTTFCRNGNLLLKVKKKTELLTGLEKSISKKKTLTLFPQPCALKK